jgi:hypothetical protein
MMNKKGQGVSSSETTGWLLAIIVLVVVALVVWFMFGYFGDTAKLAPSELTRMIEICGATAPANPQSLGTYCADYKKFTLQGVDYYYNCDDLAKQVNPSPDWAVKLTLGVCSDSVNDNGLNQCYRLNSTNSLVQGKPVKISDKECILVKDTLELRYTGKTVIVTNGVPSLT